jgi:hypothetical protein
LPDCTGASSARAAKQHPSTEIAKAKVQNRASVGRTTRRSPFPSAYSPGRAVRTFTATKPKAFLGMWMVSPRCAPLIVKWNGGATGAKRRTAAASSTDFRRAEVLARANIIGPSTVHGKPPLGSNLAPAATAYAFLKLRRRAADPIWFERARALPMSAIPQCRETRKTLWPWPILALNRRCRPGRLSVGRLESYAALSNRPHSLSRVCARPAHF